VFTGRHRTAGRIAELVGGRLVGSAETEVAGVAPLETAGPGDISFFASARYLPHFERSRAGAVLVTRTLSEATPGPATRIVVADAHAAMATVVRTLCGSPPVAWGIHPTARLGRGVRWAGRIAVGAWAVLGRNVRLGKDCVVGAFTTFGDDVALGDECRVAEHVTVCAGSRLGNRVILNPGARIGTPGYAYSSSASGHEHIPQVGRCVLGDDVEVGANSTIDRGSLGMTLVDDGTKIDNLVQVAHNVRIGKRCLVMAQVGLAGSTIIEDDVMLAGQAGLAGHLTVGTGARIAAQAGVIGDIPAGATVSGYPARPHREILRQAAALRALTRLAPSLEKLVEKDGGV